MDKWMKVTLAVTVPTLSFLVLNDTVQGFYGPKRELPLSYVVVEEEEPEPEEEAAVAVEEEPTEEVAEAEPIAEDADTKAPAVEIVADDGGDEAAAEETVAADAPTAEETTLVARLSPEEMAAGEAAARACASCHQFERERNAAGPHLVGLDGRIIGGVDGFRYSRALQDLNAQGAVWDMASLQLWLENPDAFAAGTRMMYKVDDAEERRLIAGWLTQREN